MILGIVAGAKRRTYATWNPSDKGSAVTLSNGNLTAVGVIANGTVRSTIGKSSGKWYWELASPTTTTANRPNVGIGTSAASLTNFVGSDASGWAFCSAEAKKYNNNIGAAFGSGFTAVSSYVGFALNMDAGTIELFVDGASKGVMFTGLTGIIYPMTSGNSSAGAATTVANFGATPFKGVVPPGFEPGVFIKP